MRSTAVLIAAFVFLIVAVIHLGRIFFLFPIVINDVAVPVWVNIIAFLLSGLLSGYLFRAYRRKPNMP